MLLSFRVVSLERGGHNEKQADKPGAVELMSVDLMSLTSIVSTVGCRPYECRIYVVDRRLSTVGCRPHECRPFVLDIMSVDHSSSTS